MALSVSASASFQQTTLDNGLRVILREVRERPLVGVWVWYRVGGRNELPGTTGVSHWVEHMLFKGGKRFGKGEITREISRRGGALNAFTWIDCTAYFETLPSSELDLALAIESDRLYDTRIEPDEAEAERSVVISEREGSENYPEFWLREEVQSVVWREHPYRLGVIGPKSDLRAMTRDNLFEHYKRFYMTNNATLVIVGDFSSPQLLDKIHGEFDKLPTGQPPGPLNIEEQPQTGERRVTVRRPGPTHYVMLAYHAPEGSHTDEFWQDVTLPMLETVRPRLRALVKLIEYKKRILVYSDFEDRTGAGTDITVPGISVGTDMDAFRRKARLFLKPHENHIAVLKVKRNEPLTPTDLKELERIQREGVPEDELARTKRQLHAQVVYSLEGVTNQGFALGFMDLVARDAAAWQTFPQALQQVTAADVQRVASTYLVEQQRTVGWFIPQNGGAS